MLYRTLHVVRHVMPGDRLATLAVEDDAMVFAYRAWHISPTLVRDMGDLSRSVAACGVLELDPDHGPSDLPIMAWLESGDLDVPMRPRIACDATRLCFEIQVRRDMIDPALLREMNEIILPIACGLLVPARVAG